MTSVITSREEPCFVQIEAHQAGVYQIGRGRSENRRKQNSFVTVQCLCTVHVLKKTLVQGVLFTVLPKILVPETLGK